MRGISPCHRQELYAKRDVQHLPMVLYFLASLSAAAAAGGVELTEACLSVSVDSIISTFYTLGGASGERPREKQLTSTIIM